MTTEITPPISAINPITGPAQIPDELANQLEFFRQAAEENRTAFLESRVQLLLTPRGPFVLPSPAI